jgi:acyl carrier protein
MRGDAGAGDAVSGNAGAGPARGLSPAQARALVLETLQGISPGPALDALGPNDDLRETLGLDSLDFLALVTRVSERTGLRIEEDDYEHLADLAGWVDLLSVPGATDAADPG